jgi:phage terminase small subunit
MNKRQKAFALEYSVDHNGAAAAIRAGYSEVRARQTARDLLLKPDVADEIARLDAVTAEELGMSKGWVLSGLKRLAEGSLTGEFPATVGVRAYESSAKMLGYMVERSESVSTELKVWTLHFDRELDPLEE